MLAASYSIAQPSYCWLWQKNAGSATDIGGTSIALYNNAVCYSGMFTTSSITIDDSVFFNKGGRDAYLVKRDNKGNLLWAKSLAGPLHESVAKIDADSQGAVYIGGTFSASMQGESTVTSNGGTDIFIAKFSAAGTLQWIQGIGSTGNDSLMTLVVDANGRLRIAGSFSGTLALGPYTLNAGSGTAFTACFDAQNGNVLQVKNYAAPASTRYVTFDKKGNIYHAGTAAATVNFGSFSLVPQCQPIFTFTPSVFWAAKLDTLANVLWLHDMAPCDNMAGLGYYRNYVDFHVDRDGLVYLSFIEGRWPAALGPSPLDPYISLIAVYSTNGVLIRRGGLTFPGFLGAGDILRYFLDAANEKVLLRNITYGQLEYVSNISAQSNINDVLMFAPAQNYATGVIDSGKSIFYFTGKSFLSKLGKQFEVNAGPDRVSCGPPWASQIMLGGSPAASCGVKPYTYSWLPATGLNSATIANPILDLSQIPDRQVYVLTVTDGNGAVKYDTVEVIKHTVPAKPSITAVNNVLFTATPANGSLQWYLQDAALPGMNSSSLAFTQDGKYRVKLTDSNLCSSISDTFYAYRIIVNAGNDTAICSGKSVRLGGNPTASTAAGTLTYEWSPANNLDSITVANPLATPVSNARYKLVVRSNFGNSATDSVSIAINPSPAPVITQQGNVLHSGYSSGNQWFLNGQLIDNATAESYTISQPGQYTVRVTGSNGCSAMSPVYEALLTELKLIVYSSGGLTWIRYNLPVATATSIDAFNIGSGIRKVLQEPIRQDAGYHTFPISTRLFFPGTYLIRIRTGEGVVSAKVIVR